MSTIVTRKFPRPLLLRTAIRSRLAKGCAPLPLPSTGTAERWAAAWRALLFRLCPSDPMTVFMAVAMLATVAMVAGYLPARRAANVNPIAALRDE